MVTKILEIRKTNVFYVSLFGKTNLKITDIIGKFTKIEDCFCHDIIEINSKIADKFIFKDANLLFPSNKTLNLNFLEYKESIIKILKEENHITNNMSDFIILNNSEKTLNYETHF